MRNVRIRYRNLQYIIIITIVSLFSGITALSGPALAHEGHAGKRVVFLKKEEALKQILPAGSKRCWTRIRHRRQKRTLESG